MGRSSELWSRSETSVAEARFLIRVDATGMSAMSTLCTYDLAPLDHRLAPPGAYPGLSGGGPVWVSPSTGSAYDDAGRVLAGPAVAPLPYYKIFEDDDRDDPAVRAVYADLGTTWPAEKRLPRAGPGRAEGRGDS